MPTRYLKPGIRDSARIEAVKDPDAEILYYRLLSTVDDFGRFDARPDMVKAYCFPIRKRANADTCIQWLQALDDARLIGLYEVDGKPYLQIAKWDNKPRSAASKYPDPPADVYKRMQMLPVTVTVTVTETETETETTPLSSALPIPDCPQAEIVKLYGEILPMLRQPREWNGSRATALQARWRHYAKENGVSPGYRTREDGLEFWRKYFAYVAECRTLVDGIPRREPGSEPWKPDLPWLVKAENFVKVIEGKYA